MGRKTGMACASLHNPRSLIAVVQHLFPAGETTTRCRQRTADGWKVRMNGFGFSSKRTIKPPKAWLVEKMTHNSIRVEPIDHRHPAWRDVLAAIFRTGHREALMLREDGWLSSRQTVLAAFDGQHVVGHLCFRVEAVRGKGGQSAVRSKMDSFSVDGEYAGQAVDELLVHRACLQARMMKCPPPRIEMAAC